MEKCKICGKEFKRITSSHLKTHDMTYQKYVQPHCTCLNRLLISLKQIVLPGFLAAGIAIILPSILMLGGIYNIGVPLEHIAPGINTVFPSNLDELFEANVALRLQVTDYGGSGIDYENSNVSLKKGEEEINLSKEINSQDNVLKFYTSKNLTKGKYDIFILLKDKAGNPFSHISTFKIVERPKPKLNVYTDLIPEIIANKAYAKIMIQNYGEETLSNFFVGYKFANSTYNWANMTTTVLLPGQTTIALLDTNLTLNCSVIAKANTEFYVEPLNKTNYILPINVSKRVCLFGVLDISIFSYNGFNQNFTDYRYPYYEGEVEFGYQKINNNTIVVKSKEEIPKSAQKIDVMLIDIGTLCISKAETYEYCFSYYVNRKT